jgi:hypothetical protein
MRLLCIKSSFCNKPAILVHEGSTYNLTSVSKGLTLEGTNNNVWYTLLETGISTHHSSLFVVHPDEFEEVTEVTEELSKILTS